MSAAPPPARVRAAHLLAKPGGGGLHLHLPAAAVHAARVGVLGRDRDRRRACPRRDILLAGLFGYGAANTAFGGLAIILVGRREIGILKRLRSTPLPPATYIAAVLLSTLVVFALQALALLVLGAIRVRREHARELARLRRRGRPRRRLLRRSRRRRGLAHPLGRGRLGRRQRRPAARWRSCPARSGRPTTIPAFLDAIADVLPLTYFLDIVNGVYLDGESLFADPKALAIVAAWGAAGLAVALRRFSWMPRER